MDTWILGLVLIWLLCGAVVSALYLREAAKVEILPFDYFMAGALVLFGPVGFLKDR